MAMIGQGKTRGQVAVLNAEAAINQNCVAIILKDGIDRDYVWHQLLFRYKQIRNISNSSGQQNLNGEIIKGIVLPFPAYNQQCYIGKLLNQWDAAIEKTEALIAAKEKRFKWLLKTLISDQQDNPEWLQVKLENVCKVLRGQGLSKDSISENGENQCILYGQLYTIYREVIDKSIGRTNIKNGIFSKSGDVLIPGSTTTQGIDLAKATALLEDNVLLGGDINILRATENDVYDPSFLAYYLTHSKKREIARYTQGITIVHLYGKDLKKLDLFFPEIEKQKKIVQILENARKEMNLLCCLSEKYRTQKRGLMQKLLTGEWRINL